jgi:hypothetical protein
MHGSKGLPPMDGGRVRRLLCGAQQDVACRRRPMSGFGERLWISIVKTGRPAPPLSALNERFSMCAEAGLAEPFCVEHALAVRRATQENPALRVASRGN